MAARGAAGPTVGKLHDSLPASAAGAHLDQALIDQALMDNALIDQALIDQALFDQAKKELFVDTPKTEGHQKQRKEKQPTSALNQRGKSKGRTWTKVQRDENGVKLPNTGVWKKDDGVEIVAVRRAAVKPQKEPTVDLTGQTTAIVKPRRELGLTSNTRKIPTFDPVNAGRVPRGRHAIGYTLRVWEAFNSGMAADGVVINYSSKGDHEIHFAIENERQEHNLDEVGRNAEERELAPYEWSYPRLYSAIWDTPEDKVGEAITVHEFMSRRSYLTCKNMSPLNKDKTGTGRWLNDECVNFYMSMLNERALSVNAMRDKLDQDGRLGEREKKRHPKCVFLTSFFATKLTTVRKKNEGKNNKTCAYEAMKGWTEKNMFEDITKCDKIIVPVNEDNCHWTLAVVDVVNEELVYYDSYHKRNPQVLDSLWEWYRGMMIVKGEMKDDTAAWPKKYPNDIPEQKNGIDCGVFMCKYADCLGLGDEFEFNEEDMPGFRDDMVVQFMLADWNVCNPAHNASINDFMSMPTEFQSLYSAYHDKGNGQVTHYENKWVKSLAEQLNLKRSSWSYRSHAKPVMKDRRRRISVHRQIIGDGNCLFRSLSFSLHGAEDKHGEIRADVVNYLRLRPHLRRVVSNHPQEGMGLDSDRRHSLATWNEWLEDMEKDGEWGDHIVVVTAAKLYGRQIVVANVCDHGTASREVHAYNEKAEGEPIILWRKGNNHYMVGKVDGNDEPVEGGRSGRVDGAGGVSEGRHSALHSLLPPLNPPANKPRAAKTAKKRETDISSGGDSDLSLGVDVRYPHKSQSVDTPAVKSYTEEGGSEGEEEEAKRRCALIPRSVLELRALYNSHMDDKGTVMRPALDITQMPSYTTAEKVKLMCCEYSTYQSRLHTHAGSTRAGSSAVVWFKCKCENCEFEMKAKEDVDGMLTLTKWKKHTCSAADNKEAYAGRKSTNYSNEHLGNVLVGAVRKDPSYKNKDARKKLADYIVGKPTAMMVSRAMDHAREVVEGSWEEQPLLLKAMAEAMPEQIKLHFLTAKEMRELIDDNAKEEFDRLPDKKKMSAKVKAARKKARDFQEKFTKLSKARRKRFSSEKKEVNAEVEEAAKARGGRRGRRDPRVVRVRGRGGGRLGRRRRGGARGDRGLPGVPTGQPVGVGHGGPPRGRQASRGRCDGKGRLRQAVQAGWGPGRH